jgi:hypothetical protein
METVLTFSIGGLPPFSARGCVQTLKPIQLGKMMRTINGALLHLGPKALKYQSIIEAKDKSVLAVDHFSPGSHVRVGCIQRLWEKVAGGYTHELSRANVPGSVCVVDNEQNLVQFSQSGTHITLSGNQELSEDKEYFVTYRPYLDMRITDFSLKTKEWSMETEWTLHLDEI